MYLLYLDDSGSSTSKDEEYLILGGISVFERQVHWIQNKLDDIASSLSPTSPSSIEFHASDIFSGRTPPWNGKKKEERNKIISDVLDILTKSHESTAAFACAVHKKSFTSRDPMEIAFEQLCSRFDLQLKRFHHQKNTQRGLIILDESSYETSLQEMARNFRNYGTRWGVLVNLADVPLFIKSEASRIVQLADHIAYAVFRYYERKDTQFFDLILPRFDSEEGKIHGLIHMQTIKPDCWCPACMSRKLTK